MTIRYMNPIPIVGGGDIRPTKIFLHSSAPASYWEGTVREEAHTWKHEGLLLRVTGKGPKMVHA